MNKHIFKKCKVLGAYYEMTMPYCLSPKELQIFYNKHSDVIEKESKLYGQIHHDRVKLGGNDKIHKTCMNE